MREVLKQMQMVIKILPGGAAEQGHQIFWALKRAVSKRRFLTIVYRGKKNWTRKFGGRKVGGSFAKAMGRGRKSQNEAAPCPDVWLTALAMEET